MGVIIFGWLGSGFECNIFEDRDEVMLYNSSANAKFTLVQSYWRIM